MKTKFLFLSLLTVSLFVLVGCAVNNNSAQNNGNKNQLSGNSNNTPRLEMKIDLPTTTAENLIVGKDVLVMGTAGTDGSISATRIIVGDTTSSLSFFNGQRGFASSTFASGTRPTGANNNGQRPQFNGNNFQGNGGGNGQAGQKMANQRRSGGNGTVRGEILQKDNVSIVVKDNAGGSRIVFYSDKTEIYIAPATSTMPFGRPTTNTPPSGN